jgi:hypothetical protein
VKLLRRYPVRGGWVEVRQRPGGGTNHRFFEARRRPANSAIASMVRTARQQGVLERGRRRRVKPRTTTVKSPGSFLEEAKRKRDAQRRRQRIDALLTPSKRSDR